MKNKIILCLALIMLLFSGCTSSQPKMNIAEIENGDFSSIAGTYTNPEGKSIQLDEDGLQWHEKQAGEIHCSEDGFCSMGIHGIGIPDGGYALSIYPAGMEIPSLQTDISKIRICYGQAEPMSELEIYTYISNQVDPVEIESEYQAFIMKEYYDVLYEISEGYGLFNPHIQKDSIRISGIDIQIDYDVKERIFQLDLSKRIDYVKDNQSKQAEFTLKLITFFDGSHTSPSGKLSVTDGQTFDIVYGGYPLQLLDGKTHKPIQFVEGLHQSLIDVFEDAETISKLQYQILSAWSGEMEDVENKNKTLDEILNARDIENQSSYSFQQDTLQLLRQAFNDKHYYNVLEQCFRQRYIKNYYKRLF